MLEGIAAPTGRNGPPGDWGSGIVKLGPDHPLVSGDWKYGPGAACGTCNERFKAGDVVKIYVDSIVEHARCKFLDDPYRVLEIVRNHIVSAGPHLDQHSARTLIKWIDAALEVKARDA
jgi:hypothetical protein